MKKFVKKLISISEKCLERLEKASQELGIPQTELIRRAIDDYLLKISHLIDSEDFKNKKGDSNV